MLLGESGTISLGKRVAVAALQIGGKSCQHPQSHLFAETLRLFGGVGGGRGCDKGQENVFFPHLPASAVHSHLVGLVYALSPTRADRIASHALKSPRKVVISEIWPMYVEPAWQVLFLYPCPFPELPVLQDREVLRSHLHLHASPRKARGEAPAQQTLLE